MGGADPRSPARPGLRTGTAGPGDPEDVARDRDAAGPAPAERPAPRDQPEADPAMPAEPLPPPPDRGGRSSGGATRPPPPSPSAGGGASGRSRDAYASPVPA